MQIHTRKTRFGFALCLSVLSLSACGPWSSDSESSKSSPSTSARSTPVTKFDLANGCYRLQPQGGSGFVGLSENAWIANAPSAKAALFYMKPTALAQYLLHDTSGQMLSGQAGQISSVARASDAANWTLATVKPSQYTLNLSSQGQFLAAASTGALSLASAPTIFNFVVASGCKPYPEISDDMIGEAHRGQGVDKPVIGFAEVHTHMAMGHEMSDGSSLVGPSAGGVMYGQMFHRFGVPHAMDNCEDWHGPNGIRDPEALVLDLSPLTTHETGGWPGFVSWPAYDSQLHQAMYYKWVERAWKAGMRIMVSEGTNIAALCEVGRLAVLRPDADCNDMSLGIKQVKYLFDLQNYVDAQEGGPGKGWFRIVTSPKMAREVINEGKLAVVAGLEFSNIFDCTVKFNPLGGETRGCTKESIDRQIDEVWNLGVRELYPYHDVNSALGGTGIFNGDTLNLVGFVGTNRFWDTYDCPDTGEGEKYFYNAGAVMTTAVPGSGNDPISQAVIGLLQGPTPIYPADRRQCNARGMTDLGEYAMNQLMKKKFIIDIDHAEISIKQKMLDMAKAQTPSYPMISAHGGHGGISLAQAKEILDNGGLIYPFKPNGKGHVDFMKKLKPIWPAGKPMALGYGMDANGIADRAPPRGAGSKPVKYPFTLFTGPDWGDRYSKAGIKPVTVKLQTIPESGKSWHIDEVGTAHYGMVADYVEEVRLEGGQEALDALYNSAEAYLQMWERVVNR